MPYKIKICCISSHEEARLAIRHGADALGLVGSMPSGPGPIADELIASIAKTIHPPIASFLLTSEQTAKGIIAHVNRVHTRMRPPAPSFGRPREAPVNRIHVGVWRDPASDDNHRR